jgi:uncharacterized membrane protein
LSSDRVWRATHRLGGWTFIAAGLVSFVAAAFAATAVMLIAVLAAGLVPVAYSYVVWRREQAHA